MQHQQVIENFINNGTGGRGTFVKANEGDVLYSQFPANYRPYGRYSYSGIAGQTIPLAVRLEGESLLMNGAGFGWPVSSHQTDVLRASERSRRPFGVVPFHSIVAAWTDGEVRDWNRKPIPTKTLRKEVGIVVPSGGEQWKEVDEKDKHGKVHKRQVHTLGESLVRVRDRYYLSGVDETGRGRGMYFLAELRTDRPPASLREAFDFLKPKEVLGAEACGASVRRQGEWFAIPTKLLTSELMRDVARGIAFSFGQLIAVMLFTVVVSPLAYGVCPCSTVLGAMGATSAIAVVFSSGNSKPNPTLSATFKQNSVSSSIFE